MNIQPLPDETLEEIIDHIGNFLAQIVQSSSNLQPSQIQIVKKAAMTQVLGRIDYGNFFPEEKAHLQEALNNGKGDLTAVQYLLYSLNRVVDARNRSDIMPDYIKQIREYTQQTREPVEKYA